MSTVDETTNSQIFENVWQKTIPKIDGISDDDDKRRFLRALVMGGSVTAESVVSTSDALRKLWGAGSETAATELTHFFSLITLSQLYRWVKENPPQDASGTIPPENHIAQIVSIFDGVLEKSLLDYSHFDQQFACDIAKHGHLTHVSTLR